MAAVLEMLSYPFMVRALIGGILISLCASLLGVSLVLKRYSMIGDGLSHVSFGALSIALAIGWSPLESVDPGGGAGGFFPSADYGKWKSQERCGNRHDLCQRPCCRYCGDFSDDRHDDGCQQLYVRQYFSHEHCRCENGGGAVCSGTGTVCVLL